jgi:hypothetical protein
VLNVFEQSVLRGTLDENERDYYAAVWTSLGFFHGADSARQMLVPLDVMTQRSEVDSIINVLFLPLDSDPITPGNSFLQGLAEKIDYCRNRGVLHAGGPYLSHAFDDIGILILLNGLPSSAFTVEAEPMLCGRGLSFPVPEYHVGWDGEDYFFQEDCWGFWRFLRTEFPRGGGGATPERKFNEQLTGGVAVFDPDEPLDERSAIVQPVSIRDTTDWQSEWIVVNIGLRAKDFVRDSSGWKRLRMHGALSVAVSGSDLASVVDSVSLDIDLGREKPGRDDLVALQRVEKAVSAGGEYGAVRGRVLGIDITNPKNHHWKKSVPFPVGWSQDSVTIGYGWLLNPLVVNAGCIGGRPPLIHDVVARGDSLLLFFQLVGADSDPEGRFRTHVRLRFIREEERQTEITISRLYRLGTEPLTTPGACDVLSAATEVGMIETSSASSNVTFSAPVPVVDEGPYRIIAECHRTTGTDPHPFEMVIFSDVRIRQREIQAAK